MFKNITESKAVLWAAIIGAIATIAAAIISISNKPNTPSPQDPIQISLTSPAATQPGVINTTEIPATETQVLATPTLQPTLTSTATIEPTSSTTFIANFDNPADWPDLPAQARISQGKLAVAVRNNEWVWVPMPFKTSQNFTIQAEMTFLTGHGCYTRMGFALGQKDALQHSFLIKGTDCDSRNGGNVGFYDNNAELFTTKLGFSTMERNQPRVVRLEAKDGLYTLYVDGQLGDYTDRVTPYGDDFGIFAWYAAQISPAEATFTFDNVTLINQ